MKKSAEIEKTAGDPELAWRVLGLLNLYRLAIPSVLVVLALVSSRPQLLGAANPTLYFYTLAAWFATGVICIDPTTIIAETIAPLAEKANVEMKAATSGAAKRCDDIMTYMKTRTGSFGKMPRHRTPRRRRQSGSPN